MYAITSRFKNLTTAALMALPLFVVSGCGSYWRNRAADAGDMVTVAGGLGLGVTAHAGPATTGLGFIGDCAGIRNGMPLWQGPSSYDASFTGQMIIFGIDGNHSHTDLRNKSWVTTNLFIFPYPLFEASEQSQKGLNWTYFTNFEIGLGAGLSARVGFNPGELVDFLVGWFGVDLAHDDLVNPPPTKPILAK